jgi:hypothetical protein
MVITAFAPAAREPRATLTRFPLPPHVPSVVVQLRGIRLRGRLSVTVTSDATPGPVFVTRIVSVIDVPVTAGFGVATRATPRSAVPVSDAELNMSMQSENAELLPAASVAVAVIVCPGCVASGNDMVNDRLPPPLVFCFMNPIRI